MIQKSPAFSFYAKDFLTGTATMSLVERGAYVTLLAHEWDAGVVPIDATARARVLGCTAAQERSIWKALANKFVERHGEGFVNTRLEQERQKQLDRRQKLAENGSKGGSQKVANAKNLLLQQPQQMGGQKSSLPSSSSFSSSIDPSKNDGSRERTRPHVQGPGAFEPGSLPRDHVQHEVCGPSLRFCLKRWEFRELAKALNNPSPEETRSLITRFVSHLEQSGQPIGIFSDVENSFKAWLILIGKSPVRIDKPKPRGVAEILAERDAAKGKAS